MAQPMYNSAANIPTNADTEGRWKGFMSNGTGAIKVRTFNGEDLTIDAVAVNTIYPIAFKKVYNSGTTIDDGKLIGLN